MKLVIAALVGAVVSGIAATLSPANAASSSGSVTATLTISGECEVITAPLSGTAGNFITSGVVSIAIIGSYIGAFDLLPAILSPPAVGNVAVLCSAGGANHTISFSTSANMTGGTSGATIPWTAQLNGTNFTTQAASATINANALLPTLTTYTVTGTVAGSAVGGAVPDAYAATVTITVSY